MQIKSVEKFHQQHTNETEQHLKNLQAIAMQRGNTFKGLMNTVKYASLGQISHALYVAGGEYRRNM